MLDSDCSPSNGFDPNHQFALVSYIPDPLGKFLDDLRLQIDPGCKPHAHVTILPPRPLCASADKAVRSLTQQARTFQPFSIDLVEVAKFDVSDVVYLQVGKGRPELRAMYEAMNCGPCEYSERFRYTPHITLAQNLDPQIVESAFAAIQRAWRDWSGLRSFRVDALHFVENTGVPNPSGANWVELARIDLQTPPPPPLTRTDQVASHFRA